MWLLLIYVTSYTTHTHTLTYKHTQPIAQRFRYHFDGARKTNQLDKPEWFLSYVLGQLRCVCVCVCLCGCCVVGSGYVCMCECVCVCVVCTNAAQVGCISMHVHIFVCVYVFILI
jgi:hypothetical protein